MTSQLTLAADSVLSFYFVLDFRIERFPGDAPLPHILSFLTRRNRPNVPVLTTLSDLHNCQKFLVI